MDISKKFLTYALLVTLILIYGTGLAVGVSKLDIWRSEKAQEYLSKARNTTNVSLSLQLSEKSVLLRKSEEGYLLAGTAAVELGNGQLGEKYLVNVKSGEGLLELGKAQLKQGRLAEARISLTTALSLLKTEEPNRLLYLAGGDGQYPDVSRETNPAKRAALIYNTLITLGYPQAAILRLANDMNNSDLSRDALIELGIWQMSQDKYADAYSLLLRAKAKDPYYPQVYQQLVLVCEKLGKTTDGAQYQSFLNGLSI